MAFFLGVEFVARASDLFGKRFSAIFAFDSYGALRVTYFVLVAQSSLMLTHFSIKIAILYCCEETNIFLWKILTGSKAAESQGGPRGSLLKRALGGGGVGLEKSPKPN